MKILHFVDTAGSDENFVKAENWVRIEVENNTSVLCWFTSQDGDLTPDKFDITVTAGKADETALKLAEYMIDGNVGHGGIIKFIAGSNPISEASAVAFTAGT